MPQAPAVYTRQGPKGVLHPPKGSRVTVVWNDRQDSAIRRAAIIVALSAVLLLAANVAPAHAISRPQVLKRANHWIKKKVMYSQSGHFEGYRRDCSGFVSMAWKLKTSYTSSTIVSVSKRISMNCLKPGDAVRRVGHVEIFGGWKNKKKKQYWALEEQTWGRPALRAAKKFKSGYMALRLPGITDKDPAPKTATKPVAPVITPAPLPSDPPTSTETSPSCPATPTPSEPTTPSSAS